VITECKVFVSETTRFMQLSSLSIVLYDRELMPWIWYFFLKYYITESFAASYGKINLLSGSVQG